MIDIPKEVKREILETSKNLWLSGLFSAIPNYFIDISFEEHKDIFFQLIKEALDAKIIKFCTPNHIWREDYDIWDISPDQIVTYLRDGFPKSATDEFDEDVNLYFYTTAPTVLWQQEDGSYYGS